MDEARHDSEPANLEDDPLRRIAALERRVAVLTRENERLESFLAIQNLRAVLGEGESGSAQPA